MTPSHLLTTDVDLFLKRLRKGDILLFDSIHPLSHLIKFAENRPVNHSALYLGDHEYGHATQHEPLKTADGTGRRLAAEVSEARAAAAVDVPAARVENLRERLLSPAGESDRTVTALRHENWSERNATTVVNCARSYIDPQDTTYNYLGLFGLMVPSLLRTYNDYFESKTMLKAFAGTMEALAQSVVEVFQDDANRMGRGNGRTLTCSEFVYRSFDEANESMKLDMTRPLGRWPDPARLRSDAEEDGGNGAVGAANVAGFSVVDGEGLVDFDETFQSNLLGAYQKSTSRGVPMPPGDLPPAGGGFMSAGSPEATGGDPVVTSELFAASQLTAAGVNLDMAKTTGKVLVNLLRVNKQRKKYDQAASQEGDPLADLITPRDLWSSKSLTPVAVLHRLPSSSDEFLDKAHGGRGDD